MPILIRLLKPGDAAVFSNVPSDVFDNPLDEEATAAFLADPNHFIVVALDGAKDGRIVGFASAVKTFHPDKPAPELWINEVGVAPAYQQRGVGKQITARLFEAARAEGCREAWVLTDADNKAALALYQSAGGGAPTSHVMIEFDLSEEKSA